MNKKWYAVYTKPRWEKKVAEILTGRGIVNYCPLNRIDRQWSDRRKIVYEPLFTSYVFVQVTEADHKVLRACDGVINLVHWLGKPAVIRDYEIEAIRDFLKEYSNVQLQRPGVQLHDRVRIINGPLMELEGAVVVINNNTVKVELPSLGCLMYATVNRADLQLLRNDIYTRPGIYRTA